MTCWRDQAPGGGAGHSNWSGEDSQRVWRINQHLPDMLEQKETQLEVWISSMCLVTHKVENRDHNETKLPGAEGWKHSRGNYEKGNKKNLNIGGCLNRQVGWVDNKETKGSSDFWTEWLGLVGPTERWPEERTNAKKLQLYFVGWQGVVGRVLLLCTGSKWVGDLELALPQEPTEGWKCWPSAWRRDN